MGLRGVVAVLVGFGAVLRVSAADACTPGGMTGSRAAPVTGSVVPRNIPAVYVFPGWSYYGPPCTGATVTLTQAPSTPVSLVASSTDPNTYLLGAELEPGATYLLDYAGSCIYTTGKQIFQASASQPLPSETGKLDVIASGTGTVPWSQGSCSWSIFAAWAQLRLRPSCELVPFLPVTRFVAEANGKLLWTSGVGSTAASQNEGIDSTTVDLIKASCNPGSWGLLDQGKYTITMRAEIIGSSIQPKPAEISLELLCQPGGTTSPPPQPPGGLVDTTLPCIADFDAAPPTLDAGIEASIDVDPDADAGSDANVDVSVDTGFGGSAGAPEDACADVGETGAPAPSHDARLPGDDPGVGPGGGCDGCAQPSRGPVPDLAPLAPLVVAWFAGRWRRRNVPLRDQ